MNRLRLEHTRITHSCVIVDINAGQRPLCNFCDALTSVEHIVYSWQCIERHFGKTVTVEGVLGEKCKLENLINLVEAMHFFFFFEEL